MYRSLIWENGAQNVRQKGRLNQRTLCSWRTRGFQSWLSPRERSIASGTGSASRKSSPLTGLGKMNRLRGNTVISYRLQLCTYNVRALCNNVLARGFYRKKNAQKITLPTCINFYTRSNCIYTISKDSIKN